MKQPKLLVTCEYSQRVMTAFLNKGFDAYSCDIIDTEGDYPERHFKMDARKAVFLDKWDLVIAQMLEARDFFMFFWNFVSCPVCIVNPRPLKLAALPTETQVVNPTMFGSQFTRRTYLWLRKLPPLLPITVASSNCKSWESQRLSGKGRSLIDVHLAQAMADQWAPIFL